MHSLAEVAQAQSCACEEEGVCPTDLPRLHSRLDVALKAGWVPVPPMAIRAPRGLEMIDIKDDTESLVPWGWSAFDCDLWKDHA